MTFGVLKCAVLLSSPYPGTFVYLGNARRYRRDEETKRRLRSVDLWTTLDSTSYTKVYLVLVGQIFAHNFSSSFGLTKESATGAFDKAAKTEALRVSGR